MGVLKIFDGTAWQTVNGDGAAVAPAARVRRAAVQSIDPSTVVSFGWDTLVSSTDPNMVPVVANGIKVLTAGRFTISGSAALDFVGSTTLLHLALMVNGSSAKVVHRGSFDASVTPTVVSWTIDQWPLNANDVVSAAAFHTRASAVNTYAASIYFTELAVRQVGP